MLEPTKKATLEMKAALDSAGITNQDAALRQAAGQPFYNTSPFTLSDLRNRASQQQLRADFEAYLDGFSPNCRRFWITLSSEIRCRASRKLMCSAPIEKLLHKEINLGPSPVRNVANANTFKSGFDSSMTSLMIAINRRSASYANQLVWMATMTCVAAQKAFTVVMPRFGAQSMMT